MTDRNEMKAAAELVLGNPGGHSPAELAIAGMLLELVEAPIIFFEHDGTERRLRLDGGYPDAGVEPSYCIDDSHPDAFKQLKNEVLELRFKQGQCERWHIPVDPALSQKPAKQVLFLTAPPPVESQISDAYWLDRDGNKHAISCPGNCGDSGGPSCRNGRAA